MLQSLRAAATALALCLVTACAESPMAPGAAAAGLPTSTALSAGETAFLVAGCDGAAVALGADEKRTLDFHNTTRRSLGLSEFCVDSTLTVAARAHSQEMLAKGYFAHDSFDGRSFDVRIRALGYPVTRGLAENAAWGTGPMGEAVDVFGRWMASDVHHHNIVDGSLRRIGVGVAAGTYLSHAGARMYTVDFGTE